MDGQSRLNDSVFNTSGSPLYVVNLQSAPLFISDTQASNVIKSVSLTGTTPTAVWTPAAGKSIHLTALTVSASVLALFTITLSRTSGAFLVIGLTSSFATYQADYCIPVQFDVNESITMTLSGVGTTVNYSLFGFEN